MAQGFVWEARKLLRAARVGTLASSGDGQPFASLVTPACAADLSVLLLTDNSPRQLVAVDTLSGRRTVLRTIAPANRAFIGPTSVFLTPDGRSYVANYQRRVMTLFLVDGLK